MRRKEKEITGKPEIVAIIRKAFIFRLAMSDGKNVYRAALLWLSKQQPLLSWRHEW